MSATLENIRHGTQAFPMGLYRQRGDIPDYCVTPLHYHGDLEILLMLEGSTMLV